MINKYNIDKEKSAQIAKIIESQRKQCWRNAALACVSLADDMLDQVNSYYVEGWIILPIAGGIPIEHGWVVWTPTGRDWYIIEPTLWDDCLLGDFLYVESCRFVPREVFQFKGPLPFLTLRDAEHQESWKLVQSYLCDKQV